jgi:hypothetical protein
MVLHYKDINVLTFRWKVQHGPPLQEHQYPHFQMRGPTWSSLYEDINVLTFSRISSMVLHYEDINVLIYK